MKSRKIVTSILVLSIIAASIPTKIYANTFSNVFAKFFHSSNVNEDELYIEKSKLSSEELISEIIEIEKNINYEDEMCLLPHYTALIEKANEFSDDELISLIKSSDTKTGIEQAFVNMYGKNNYTPNKIIPLLYDSGVSDETKEYIVSVLDFSIDELCDIFRNSNDRKSIIAMKKIAVNNSDISFELVNSKDIKSMDTDEEYISFCLGVASHFEKMKYSHDQTDSKKLYVELIKDIYSTNDSSLVKDQAIYALARICDYELFSWLIYSEDIDFDLKVTVIERNINLMQKQILESNSIDDIQAIVYAMNLHPIINIANEITRAIENGNLEKNDELTDLVNKISKEGIMVVNKYE